MTNEQIIQQAAVTSGLFTQEAVDAFVSEGLCLPLHTYQQWNVNNNYIGFEIHYPATRPTENGKYFGRTPIFEQALNAVKSINGALYGITSTGQRIFIFY